MTHCRFSSSLFYKINKCFTVKTIQANKFTCRVIDVKDMQIAKQQIHDSLIIKSKLENFTSKTFHGFRLKNVFEYIQIFISRRSCLYVTLYNSLFFQVQYFIQSFEDLRVFSNYLSST